MGARAETRQARRHPLDEHQRHPARPDFRRLAGRSTATLLRYPLLQSAALSAFARSHPRRADVQRSPRLCQRLRRPPPWQGDRTLQGYAQLHCQPHRQLLGRHRRQNHDGGRLLCRGSGCHHRSADRPSGHRQLPLARFSRTRHLEARWRKPLSRSSLRQVARPLSAPSRPPENARKRLARRQERPRLLQEGWQRKSHPCHRLEDARIRAFGKGEIPQRRASQATRRSARAPEDAGRRQRSGGRFSLEALLRPLHLLRRTHPRNLRSHR